MLIEGKRKTKPFQMEELEEVLKGLKTNKARDPEGISRTIFKNNVIGTNLIESLLILFNKLKSAGKFGPDKCKTMVVSKKPIHSFQNPELEVDAWKLKHKPNGNMIESFIGKVTIQNEDALMYLGYVLDQRGGNMKNILHKRNKAMGTQKIIQKLIKNLGKFTFEGAVIYIESLIRTSILYGSETMFNVKENKFRALEAIEESVLVKTFQTLRSCSRHLLYLNRYDTC